jgi:hypothetical protein
MVVRQAEQAVIPMSSSETYPTFGAPAIDEAIRQTFTSLVQMRDAHGTGETPASGTFCTDGAGHARRIQTDIKGKARRRSLDRRRR